MTQRLPAHQALYAASQGLHQQLDQHPLLARLLSPELGLPAYSTSLSRLYHAMVSLELALAQYQQQGLPDNWSSYQPRAPFLAADLELLGNPVYDRHTTSPPALATLAEYLGTRYVLEGASLGSAHIARYLQDKHATLYTTACSYWEFQRTQARHWAKFLGYLANLDDDSAQQQQASAAAQAAFRVFLAQLDE